MKKFVAISALAVASLAGAAFGQANDAAAFTGLSLQFCVVARSGNTTDGFTDATGPLVVDAGATQRFQVRYRVAGALPATTGTGATRIAYTYRGLAASVFNVTSSSPSSRGVLSAGFLTAASEASAGITGGTQGTGSNWNDASGDGSSNGLHGTFRTGVFTGSPDSNGDFTPGANLGISTIVALNTAITGAGGVANTLGNWYGIYDFDFTNTGGTGGDVTLNIAGLLSDSVLFIRRANGSSPSIVNTDLPVASPGSFATGTTNTITFTAAAVPAPASAALLGLGGLVAARRRRA